VQLSGIFAGAIAAKKNANAMHTNTSRWATVSRWLAASLFVVSVHAAAGEPNQQQAEKAKPSSERAKVAEGEYVVLEGANGGAVGPFGEEIYNFHETWTLWRTARGRYYEGRRGETIRIVSRIQSSFGEFRNVRQAAGAKCLRQPHGGTAWATFRFWPAAVLLKGDLGFESASAGNRLESLTSIGLFSIASSFNLVANNSNRNKLFESLAVAYNQGRAVKFNQVLALEFA